MNRAEKTKQLLRFATLRLERNGHRPGNWNKLNRETYWANCADCGLQFNVDENHGLKDIPNNPGNLCMGPITKAMDEVMGHCKCRTPEKYLLLDKVSADIATEYGDGTQFKAGDVVLHNHHTGRFRKRHETVVRNGITYHILTGEDADNAIAELNLLIKG